MKTIECRNRKKYKELKDFGRDRMFPMKLLTNG